MIDLGSFWNSKVEYNSLDTTDIEIKIIFLILKTALCNGVAVIRLPLASCMWTRMQVDVPHHLDLEAAVLAFGLECPSVSADGSPDSQRWKAVIMPSKLTSKSLTTFSHYTWEGESQDSLETSLRKFTQSSLVHLCFQSIIFLYWSKTRCLITSWQKLCAPEYIEKLKPVCIWQAFKNVKTVLMSPSQCFFFPRWSNGFYLVDVSCARHILDVLPTSCHESCQEHHQRDIIIDTFRWENWGSERKWPQGPSAVLKLRLESQTTHCRADVSFTQINSHG